jgi:hypothetical protein
MGAIVILAPSHVPLDHLIVGLRQTRKPSGDFRVIGQLLGGQPHVRDRSYFVVSSRRCVRPEIDVVIESKSVAQKVADLRTGTFGDAEHLFGSSALASRTDEIGHALV